MQMYRLNGLFAITDSLNASWPSLFLKGVWSVRIIISLL